MARLAIRRVSYRGDRYEYDSPLLTDGWNILEGQNRSGKSTFANLIYFGLGGQVDSFRAESSHRHPEIVGDTNNWVSLLVSLDDEEYVFQRFLRTNDIAVNGPGTTEVFPLFRGPGREYTFSDWILKKLAVDPVTLQFGTYTGKINFTDLARLIYHNQEPDPTGVFKPVDNSSFVTDSRVFRRAIFEILVGRSYQEYYAALAAFRSAERERSEAAKVLELHKQTTEYLSGGREDWNAGFVDAKLKELNEQQDRLIAYRAELVKAPVPSGSEKAFAEHQRALLEMHIRQADFGRREANLLEELAKFEQLRSELVLEATQIKKMMFAHEALRLFNAITCPYCLNEVVRIPNRCVCGHEVSEADYEKYFYDSSE